MGFNYQTGAMGLGRQTSQGTPVAAQDWLKFLSGGMGVDRELIISDPEIGGGRDIDEGTIYPGGVGASGSYEHIVKPNVLGHFILGALGAVSSSALSGAAYEHTFTPAATLPWYTILERISETYETFRTTDCKVNSLELTCDANDYLKATAEIFGITPESDVSIGSPSPETTPPFLYGGATITIDGSSFLPKTVGISLTNNLEDDDFRVGSLYRGDLSEKRRELTLSATIRPANSDLFKKAVWGSATASLAQNTKSNIAVTYKWESYEVIGTTAYKYRLELAIPVAVIVPFRTEPSGDDILEHDLEIQAAKGTDSLVTVTLRNSKTSYSAA